MKSRKIVLLGGGLANGLIALFLKNQGYDDFVVVERSSQLGGDHTWSFFSSDVEPADLDILRPALEGEWPGYSVFFKSYERSFATPYNSIRSQNLHRCLVQMLRPDQLLLQTEVSKIAGNQVILESGEKIDCELILDGRGGFAESGTYAYQKFVGIDVEFSRPHGVQVPTIMDARVEQLDGYRFIYVLPFSETRALIEDTRYSLSREIDEVQFVREIETYAASFGEEFTLGRREAAALPLPLNAKSMQLQGDPENEAVIPVGVRGGWYHPITGYSVAKAAQVARVVSQHCHRPTTELRQALVGAQRRWLESCNYFLFLNRMAFYAADDHERWRVFDLFYRRGDNLIERFYRGDLTWLDKLRVLTGRPPVPINKALRCLT